MNIDKKLSAYGESPSSPQRKTQWGWNKEKITDKKRREETGKMQMWTNVKKWINKFRNRNVPLDTFGATFENKLRNITFVVQFERPWPRPLKD